MDLSGLIAPKSEIDNLIDRIESGEINRLKEINQVLHELHANYYVNEWYWLGIKYSPLQVERQ